MNILVVDDEKLLVKGIKFNLENEGYQVECAYDGAAAVDLARNEKFDLLILDVMMPEVDGFQVCRELRKESDVPIIMITARGEDFEKIMGLEIGADDYIVKPFSPGEVMARVKAVLRRIGKGEVGPDQVLTLEDLRIDLNDYSVTLSGQPVALTKREVDMLWTLVKGRNRAYSREMLLDLLWGFDYYGDLRTVDSHIKRLRAKLDALPHPGWEIRTIRGVGYKFEVLHEK